MTIYNFAKSISVAVETSTVCNHRCVYCPVSLHPPDSHAIMSMDIFRTILLKLARSGFRFKRISFNHYNEPFAEPFFYDRLILVRQSEIFEYLLVNTNLSIKKDFISKIVWAKEFLKININLPTLIPERYAFLHGHDDLQVVVENINRLMDLGFDIRINLQINSKTTLQDAESIKSRYPMLKINEEYSVSRGGIISKLNDSTKANKSGTLAGCSISRPLNYVHISLTGDVFFCCQDYFKRTVTGTLLAQELAEILYGEKMQNNLNFLYGIKSAPQDFLCNSCEFAVER